MKKGIVFTIITLSWFTAFTQNVGIGTNTPRARLHVTDSSAVFSAADPLLASPGNPPISGAGARMMWYPGKAAFRTGYIDDTQWDKDSIGYFSFASGSNTKAIGNHSTSMGYNTTASNTISTSMGYFTTASGSASTSMGGVTTASGHYSTSMGYFTTASGVTSTSMGMGTKAKALASFTLGTYNDDNDNPDPNFSAMTDRVFQVGNGTASSGSNALTVLYNGNMGIGIANPTKQLEVVGPASVTPVTLVIGNKGGFGSASLEFVSNYGVASQWRPGYIKSNGNGTITGSLEFYTNGSGSENLYGNVKGFEVRNGAALTATGAVGSYSDARLKNMVTGFTDGLNVIRKINPVQFYYNADAPFKTDQPQIGVIAQDLEKLAPYMVEKNKLNGYDDLRSVNNQAYTFLLINAVKEQQQQIERQQQQIDELKKIVEQLIKK